MSVITLEGIVENGQIRLTTGVRLPEHARVYIIIPDAQIEQVASVKTPRLANPDQVADFQMEVTEEQADAEL